MLCLYNLQVDAGHAYTDKNGTTCVFSFFFSLMLLEAKGAADVRILIFFNGIELEKKF